MRKNVGFRYRPILAQKEARSDCRLCDVPGSTATRKPGARPGALNRLSRPTAAAGTGRQGIPPWMLVNPDCDPNARFTPTIVMRRAEEVFSAARQGLVR